MHDPALDGDGHRLRAIAHAQLFKDVN